MLVRGGRGYLGRGPETGGGFIAESGQEWRSIAFEARVVVLESKITLPLA